MSGVEPQIRLGSEPRSGERPSGDLAGGGRPAFGEAAFVERALAILAQQGRPSAGCAPAPSLPILSQAATGGGPPSAWASPFLPQAVPPFVPSSVAEVLPVAPPPPARPMTAGVPPVMVPPAIDMLRKQAVDWIDSLLALVTAGVSPTPVRSNLVTVGDGASAASVAPVPLPAAPAAAPASVSSLAASAGQMVATTLRIANDGAVDAPVRLLATDLVGDSGARIPASAVAFAPAATMVGAHAIRAIEVFVAIPAGVPAGSYAGLLQLIGQPLARSLLAVDVKPASSQVQNGPAPALTPGTRA